MIRVAVVAGSAVLRAGLEALLAASPALVVVGSLDLRRSSVDVVPIAELVAPLAPDVVVWVPDESADQDAEWLAPLRPDEGPPVVDDDGASERGGRRTGPGVIVLGGAAGARAAATALRAGARGVLAREAGADEIVAAVEAAAAGLVTLPADLADELLASPGRAEPVPVGGALAPPAGLPALTGREREVLALLARGLANKAIAPALGISEHTVKAHVASIFEKLGAGTRAEAVVIAARSGLLLL